MLGVYIVRESEGGDVPPLLAGRGWFVPRSQADHCPLRTVRAAGAQCGNIWRHAQPQSRSRRRVVYMID
jgi:hypothetical protein